MRVFYANFNDNSVPPEIGGRLSIEGVGLYNGIGTGDNRFTNYFLRSASLRDGVSPHRAVTLSLAGLPAHDSIDLNFLFAVIDSWNGDDGDFFNIVVDGGTVFRHTFANVPGVSQSYNPPPGVFLGRGDYGFSHGDLDSAYNLGLDPSLNNIPHTSSSLNIEFFANGPSWGANYAQESWAIDNLEVIVNNNLSPSRLTISLGDNITVQEGNSGQTNVNIPITLSRATSEPVTVGISTANGTATAGSDFIPLNQSITFSPNSTRADVTVAVLGDTTFEPNETFFVNLNNPVGATIARGRTQITIINDDRSSNPPQPSISIQNASIREGNSGTRNMIFNVRLSGRSSQTVTADYITGNGTARAPLDYTARNGRISFAPGRTTGTITVPIKGDTLFEPNETFTLSLRNLRNVRAGNLRATGTILNDDTRSRNIDSLSLGTSDSMRELTKASDYADVFAVDTVV